MCTAREFVFAWWIFLTRGFDVLQGCNPPDDIFLVALPFKLFGVKYIFDHHDANPELYLSKYERKDALYRAQVWLEGLTYRFSDVVMATNESYKSLAISRGRRDPQGRLCSAEWPGFGYLQASSSASPA